MIGIIPVWVKALAILALVGALYAIERAWEHRIYQHGYDTAAAEWQAKERQATIDAQTALAAANAKTRAAEQSALQQVSDISTRAAQEAKNANDKINTLRAAVRDGAMRLSVPIDTASACDPAGSSKNPTTAGQSGAENRADLSRSAAEFFVEFAGQCDAAATQANALIDAYNAVKKTYNGE